MSVDKDLGKLKLDLLLYENDNPIIVFFDKLWNNLSIEYLSSDEFVCTDSSGCIIFIQSRSHNYRLRCNYIKFWSFFKNDLVLLYPVIQEITLLLIGNKIDIELWEVGWEHFPLPTSHKS